MPAIDIQRSAVLIMDYQQEVVGGFSGSQPGLIERAARVLDGARQAGIPIIHVMVAFREGYPEIGPRSTFKFIRDSGRLKLGSKEADIHPGVAPKPGDVVVVKKRISAFSGSDLDLLLRTMGRDNLILLGVATSGVVLSTNRAAFDLDYSQVIIADCCADRDQEVHRLLMEKLFARQATVMKAEEFLAALK